MESKPFAFVLTERQRNNFSKHLAKRENECWEWTASKTRNGYGIVRIGSRGLVASRIAWFIEYGVDPHPLFVLHKCDNRICCNPQHLFLGTNQENCQDSAIKGRRAVKLSPDMVIKIREQLTSGVIPQRAIAKTFGICQGTVQRIIRKNIWNHV